MNRRILLILGIVVIVLGVVASSALFTVHQTQQAIVLQFGDPKRVVGDPGLKVKLPFIQNVLYYERRVLNLDPPVQRVILADQKPLLVDTYARYRIVDALRFYQTVRSEGTAGTRLATIINATTRGVLGNVNLASVLSQDRVDIMKNIRDQVNAEARRFGIDVVDVRIRRSDLPDETSQAVYDRMKSEREREAAEFRAQGYEQAQRIRAGADREATVIRAEAEREADIQRGQGEAERTRLLNDAFGRDPDFFNFYRSMQAYQESLRAGTYLVLSPDGEFAGFFDAIGAGGVASSP
jgi:membrane protease subunit HflC